MNKKNILICGIGCALVVAAVSSFFIFANNKDEENVEMQPEPHVIQEKKTEIPSVKPTKKVENETVIKKANLYSDSPSSLIPFSAISELAALPQNIQSIVNSFVENSQGLYALIPHKDKVTLILEGSTQTTDNYPRHELELVEIELQTGHITHKTLGYVPEHVASEHDDWVFSDSKSETSLPLRHTRFNQNGDIEFAETWSYEPNESIKYKLENAEGKIISMKKDIQEDGTALRQEHIFYDKDGNTEMNISVNFEGSDITRFTYYNAEKPQDGCTIISVFEDGEKKKETVYTSEFKVKNVYTSEYKDGVRKAITIYDNENREVEKILAE